MLNSFTHTAKFYCKSNYQPTQVGSNQSIVLYYDKSYNKSSIQIMGNHETLSAAEQAKLQEGKPVLRAGGVKIIKNPQTGKLEGVPEEWANTNSIHLRFQIDTNKLAKTHNLPEQIRAYDLPDSIINLINSQPIPLNSPPLNEEKQLDLQMDPQEKYGIKNLPKEWVFKFNQSKISPQDIKSDPKAAIDIITKFQSELKQAKFEKNLLSNQQFEEFVQKVEFIEENPASNFVFDKQLGKGAMCKVFYAFDRKKEGRKDYACRIIKLNDKKTLEKIKIQIAVMKLCSEKNLVNYYFSYYFKESLFMFVEFMNVGALTDFVYHFTKKIPEEVISYIMKECLLGLAALHEKRQLHRDLKSDNILLNMQGDIKIADFGFAMQLTKQKLNRKSVVGTPAWMAPQLIRREEYDEKVDIWSLGMVTIQLCNGQPPYLRLPQLKAMQYIASKDPPRVKQFSPQLCDFVQKCLQKDPKSRWTAGELLNHKFILMIENGQKSKKKFISMLQQLKKQPIVQFQ